MFNEMEISKSGFDTDRFLDMMDSDEQFLDLPEDEEFEDIIFN